jgi:hypothetical protein
MAIITITSGHFKAYKNNATDGSSPFTLMFAEDDGAACVLKHSEGLIWVFRINSAALQYKVSTDTAGTTWGAWTTIVATLVEDGVPTAIELPSGRIMAAYWKTDGKWYQSYTDNHTTPAWTEIEITS